MVKVLHTGLIVFDLLDLLCISFFVGSGTSYLARRYNEKKKVDPIIAELKKTCRILESSKSIAIVSTEGQLLKMPLVRGGEKITNGISLIIKNEKFAIFLQKLLETKRNQKLVKLLQIYLAVINQLLTYGIGLRFAVGGCSGYSQIILVSVSGSIGGFLVGQIMVNPLTTMIFPLIILFGRGIEQVPDPHEKCKMICQIAEEYHNKQYLIEMQKLNSLVQDTSNKLNLPLDEIPLLSVKCVEEKTSLLQRFKLRQLLEGAKVRKRVQHFNKFIKQFPDCSVDLETVSQEIIDKVSE
jgi:hypothetical protein